jgi:hypothetical protein
MVTRRLFFRSLVPTRGGGRIVQTLLAVEAEAAFDVDPIEEMRLRTWARQHYARQEERDGTWHPIVLDEMTRKDQEAGSGPRLPR